MIRIRQTLSLILSSIPIPGFLSAENLQPSAAHLQWIYFAPVNEEAFTAQHLSEIPDQLPRPDGSLVSAQAAEFQDRAIDLSAALNNGAFVPEKTLAVFYSRLYSETTRSITMGSGADWWMTWYVNGKEIFTTQPGGNRRLDFNVFDHRFELPLEAGGNIIAVKVWSGSAGWRFATATKDEIEAIEKDLVLNPLDAVISSPKDPPVNLPDPLLVDGAPPILSAEEWLERGRPQLVEHYVREQYGRLPNEWDKLAFAWTSRDEPVPDSPALRSELEITLQRKGHSLSYPVTFFTPPRDQPIRGTWIHINHRGKDFGQDPDNGFCPINTIIGKGYALISYAPGHVAPDHVDHFDEGILRLYSEELEKADGCRTIGAWAWGVSRIIDYLERDPRFPVDRIAVIGHSRSSNTAQWTAVIDTRVTLVCSNNGDSLERRPFGQAISKTNLIFPHWYNDNFKRYDNNEDALPFDAHWLVAGVAPRNFHLGSGVLDLNADPRGQYLGVSEANPVYALFDMEGLPTDDSPVLDRLVLGDGLAFHARMGGHGMTHLDWEHYLTHADKLWSPYP